MKICLKSLKYCNDTILEEHSCWMKILNQFGPIKIIEELIMNDNICATVLLITAEKHYLLWAYMIQSPEGFVVN